MPFHESSKPTKTTVRPAWMNTSVIDPAWLKATLSTELAPVPDPIDTISDHLTKLLPIVFNAKRLSLTATSSLHQHQGVAKEHEPRR